MCNNKKESTDKEKELSKPNRSGFASFSNIIQENGKIKLANQGKYRSLAKRERNNINLILPGNIIQQTKDKHLE